MDKILRRRWHNMLVAAMADKQLSEEEKAYLETMRKELGITDEQAGQIVSDYKARRVSFHSWRHFANTYFRSQGIHDSKVQAVTGHKTQEMTELYTHY